LRQGLTAKSGGSAREKVGYDSDGAGGLCLMLFCHRQ
jgi:hypothetical protein